MDKNYIVRVQDALKREESGVADTLRGTPYFRSLESFITNLISREYEFEEPLRKRTVNLTANGLIRVSFDYLRQIQAGDDQVEAGQPNAQAMVTNWDPEVAFLRKQPITTTLSISRVANSYLTTILSWINLAMANTNSCFCMR